MKIVPHPFLVGLFNIMKAVIVREFGAPEQMKTEEAAVPSPGDGQILVRVAAAGVNPVDAYIRAGIHAIKPDLPYTPGKDAAGTVEAVGRRVTKFKPGDRVLTADSVTGTYADYCLCEEKHLIALPDNVSFAEGAGVFVPYATSYRALFQKARARAGETVLVHGASGGVGTAAVQWAKNAGLTVIGTAGSPEGVKLVSEQGADHALDHSDERSFDEIKSITGGKGVEIILEMLANVNLQRDFEALAMFGRITVIGSRGTLDFNPRATMTKDATVYGMSLFNAPETEMHEIRSAIFDGLAGGFLKPVVGSTFPLAEAPAAHRRVMEEKAFGKIVLLTENQTVI
jgi:NADPH:quinone reductase